MYMTVYCQYIDFSETHLKYYNWEFEMHYPGKVVSILVMMIIIATKSKSLAMEGSKSTGSENVTVVKKNQLTQSRSSYKTSEKIEKAPSEDHPCNLTKTSMKISFPALRNELFVNILGYKEPNLVRLNQCRGFCGVERCN